MYDINLSTLPLTDTLVCSKWLLIRAVQCKISHQFCNRHSFNPVKPGGCYTYTTFNIKNSFLPTQCTCVFWMDIRLNTSNCFKHWLRGFHNPDRTFTVPYQLNLHIMPGNITLERVNCYFCHNAAFWVIMLSLGTAPDTAKTQHLHLQQTKSREPARNFGHASWAVMVSNLPEGRLAWCGKDLYVLLWPWQRAL
jgi:hypothetical protein